MLVGRFLGLHVHIKEGESTPKIIQILSIFQMQLTIFDEVAYMGMGQYL